MISFDHDADRFLMSSHANRVEMVLLLLAPVEFMAHVQVGLEGFSLHQCGFCFFSVSTGNLPAYFSFSSAPSHLVAFSD